MNWYFQALRKYAVFTGRARRREYWIFTLVNLVISLGLTGADMAAGTFSEETGWGLISGLYSLAVLLPGIAVTVRRLHDIDRSGWWMLISLVPCAGGIVFLVFMLTDSTPGQNQYGPSPKEAQWDTPPPPPTF